MANVSCKYTYTPRAGGEIIRNSNECAESVETFIVVPQAETNEDLANCGTTISIDYALKNSPQGGVEITSATLEFNYDISAQGRIGQTFAASTLFPAQAGAAIGVYNYSLPNFGNETQGTYNITFYPNSTNSIIVISYVTLRITYRGKSINNTIAAPENIQIFNNYYNRVGVRWSPPAAGTDIDHYSVGIFAAPHNPEILAPGSGTLVSRGWIDVPANRLSLITTLPVFQGYTENHSNTLDATTPLLYAKVCVVTHEDEVGMINTSLTSSDNRYKYATFKHFDTLSDTNENMYPLDTIQQAYFLCRNLISFANNDSEEVVEAFLPHIDTWNEDTVISQIYYDRIAHVLGVPEIPDDTDETETLMTHDQWLAILAEL